MPTTQRIWKGIISFLLLLIFGMSVFFYYYLINLDKKYTKIIADEATLYNNIQNITYRANKGYLLLYKIYETSDKIKRDSLITHKNLLITRNDSLINEILFNLSQYKDKSSLNMVIIAREEYVKACAIFEDHLIVGEKDSAYNILTNKIEPNFLKYQKNLRSFIEANTNNVLENSGNITTEVKKHSSIVLLLGLSPIIIFSIYLIILALLFIIIFFIFRNRVYK